MSSLDNGHSSEIMETAGETGSQSVYTSDQSATQVPSGEARSGSALVETNREVDPDANRRNGWLESIGRAKLRSRVLHDIAPANSEEDAIRLFARIQRQIGENPRGSGIIIAAGHLDGAHSHVHIVHDCNWNSTSCSDVFMRGVAIKKREKGRFGRWANELAAKFWENLLYYLFGRGRRY